MIRHQAVSPYRHIVLAGPLRQQFQIDGIVFVIEESLLPPVAPLGNVMGISAAMTRAILAMAISYHYQKTFQ